MEDKGSEFYNRSMESILQDTDIEMYSTYNKGKFVIAGRFIRNLKNKIHNYMTSVWKCVYWEIRWTQILTLARKLIIKILNLKFAILLEYQNMNKNIFAKGYKLL